MFSSLFATFVFILYTAVGKTLTEVTTLVNYFMELIHLHRNNVLTSGHKRCKRDYSLETGADLEVYIQNDVNRRAYNMLV